MNFNTQIVETFRAPDGEVREPIDFGKRLVLVHVTKQDGSERVVPLATVVVDGAWHVVGSAGGSPKHPAWVHGLRKASETTIEVPGEPIKTVPVTVEELEGGEREAVWQGFVESAPAFAEYLKTAGGRVFPIFRFRAI